MCFRLLLTTFIATSLPFLTPFLLTFVAISSKPLQLLSPTLIVCKTLTPLLNTWSPLSIAYASRPNHKLHYPSFVLSICCKFEGCNVVSLFLWWEISTFFFIVADYLYYVQSLCSCAHGHFGKSLPRKLLPWKCYLATLEIVTHGALTFG